MAIDNNGEFVILLNGEGGAGFGKGLSIFVRGLFGFGDNTVDTLGGLAWLVSGNKGPYSASVSFPHKTSECPGGGPNYYPLVVTWLGTR